MQRSRQESLIELTERDEFGAKAKAALEKTQAHFPDHDAIRNVTFDKKNNRFRVTPTAPGAKPKYAPVKKWKMVLNSSDVGAMQEALDVAAAEAIDHLTSDTSM